MEKMLSTMLDAKTEVSAQLSTWQYQATQPKVLTSNSADRRGLDINTGIIPTGEGSGLPREGAERESEGESTAEHLHLGAEMRSWGLGWGVWGEKKRG